MSENAPNFFILGVPKAGTTSLFSYLCRHPDVFPAQVKETRFFSDDQQYELGLPYYLNGYFDGAAGYAARGEATPRYFGKAATVSERIKRDLGDHHPRFIVVLREPIDRAWSHYLHLQRNLIAESSFQSTVESEIASHNAETDDFAGCYATGLYRYQIDIWLQQFPRNRFLFVEYDAFKRDNATSVADIVSFLGLPPSQGSLIDKPRNVSGTPRSALLMRALTSPPKPAKRVFRAIVPARIRHELLSRIRQRNVRPFEEYPIAPQGASRLLASRYRNEVKEIENRTGLQLAEWRDKYDLLLSGGSPPKPDS